MCACGHGLKRHQGMGHGACGIEGCSCARSTRSACPYCGIPNDPLPDSLFTRISEQHNRCKVCGVVVSNSTEARDAHLAEAGCHVNDPVEVQRMRNEMLTQFAPDTEMPPMRRARGRAVDGDVL